MDKYKILVANIGVTYWLENMIHEKRYLNYHQPVFYWEEGNMDVASSPQLVNNLSLSNIHQQNKN